MATLQEQYRKGEITREQYAEGLVAEHMAAFEKRSREEPKVPEKTAADLAFEWQVTQQAEAYGVKPRAIDFVLHQCRDLFERKDGKIVARNDQRDPNDPCSPLTFRRWLEDFRSEWPEVFAS